MTTYVLVHGAWHGGWCWHRIVAGLEHASHRAIAPDLKSLGRDRTPPGEITLATWTDQIAALVQAQPEPVVLSVIAAAASCSPKSPNGFPSA